MFRTSLVVARHGTGASTLSEKPPWMRYLESVHRYNDARAVGRRSVPLSDQEPGRYLPVADRIPVSRGRVAANLSVRCPSCRPVGSTGVRPAAKRQGGIRRPLGRDASRRTTTLANTGCLAALRLQLQQAGHAMSPWRMGGRG